MSLHIDGIATGAKTNYFVRYSATTRWYGIKKLADLPAAYDYTNDDGTPWCVEPTLSSFKATTIMERLNAADALIHGNMSNAVLSHLGV